MPTRIHTVCTHEHKAALSHKGSSHADSGTKTHEAPSCWAAVQQAQLAVANEPVVLGTGDGHLVPLERAVLDAEHGKLRPKHGRHGYLRAKRRGRVLSSHVSRAAHQNIQNLESRRDSGCHSTSKVQPDCLGVSRFQ